MNKAASMIVLATAMQLHDEKVKEAIENARRLRYELEEAEKKQQQVMEARRVFITYVKPNLED